MRERIIFDERQNEKRERLAEILTEKLRGQAQPIQAIDEQEKIKISTIVQKAFDELYQFYSKYSCSLENILFYINRETAFLLAASSHPLLNEWGVHFIKFYNDDPLNKNIYPENGLVVARQGGFDGTYKFTGNGHWNIAKNKWSWMPQSLFFSPYPHPQQEKFSEWMVNSFSAPILSQYPITLLSPMHIAVFIGDKLLIEELNKKGCSLDNDHNQWQLLPVEFPIMHEQIDIIDFMLQLGLDKNKALKCAVEKGSFSIIKKLTEEIKAPISDNVLQAALNRDRDLHCYLDLKRRKDVQEQLDNLGSFNALKAILNYSGIPIQSLVDLICIYPTIIHNLENEKEGNTLVHELVNAKETTKVAALLEAIFQAGLKNIKGFFFDIEKKNKQEKTILDLALAQNNNELISAILMYNPKMNQTQQDKIVTAKIDIPAIHQEKAKRTSNIIGQQFQQIEVQQQVLEATVEELMTTKAEVLEIKQMNGFLLHQVQIQQQMLLEISERLGMQYLHEARQPLVQNQAANPNRLFAIEIAPSK